MYFICSPDMLTPNTAWTQYTKRDYIVLSTPFIYIHVCVNHKSCLGSYRVYTCISHNYFAIILVCALMSQHRSLSYCVTLWKDERGEDREQVDYCWSYNYTNSLWYFTFVFYNNSSNKLHEDQYIERQLTINPISHKSLWSQPCVIYLQ